MSLSPIKNYFFDQMSIKNIPSGPNNIKSSNRSSFPYYGSYKEFMSIKNLNDSNQAWSAPTAEELAKPLRLLFLVSQVSTQQNVLQNYHVWAFIGTAAVHNVCTFKGRNKISSGNIKFAKEKAEKQGNQIREKTGTYEEVCAWIEALAEEGEKL